MFQSGASMMWVGRNSLKTECKARFYYLLGDKLISHRFCLGDAVHRHPPSNGLGSNTCIQDAYNLAWKVAHVLQG